MALNIEDYGLIGDCHTGALVGKDGSIDWLCMPRFDSASMFGALLGDEDHGRWLVAPADEVLSVSREYLEDTFVLVTHWQTKTGRVDVTDFMPTGDRHADVVRRITGVEGSVDLREELRARFDYAAALPWMRQAPEAGGNALIAVAGPDAVVFRGPKLTAHDRVHQAEFTVAQGETVDLVLTWYPSHREPPDLIDVDESPQHDARLVAEVGRELRGRPSGTAPRCTAHCWCLRALTHEDTGGIVAAATTSLPEEFGGSRNWDYRYVWLRDASLTLYVLISHGFADEAAAWRSWLLRAIAGRSQRRADHVRTLRRAQAHRVGGADPARLPGMPPRCAWATAPSSNTRATCSGEVMVALSKAREPACRRRRCRGPLQRALLDFVEQNWRRPDNGIWGDPRAPSDTSRTRAPCSGPRSTAASAPYATSGSTAPAERWERLRAELRDEIETEGWDANLGSYTQFYRQRHGRRVPAAAVADRLSRRRGPADCSAPSPRSSPPCCATGSSCATSPRRASTACPAASIRSWPARSGSPSSTRARAGWMRRSPSMDRLVGFANDLGLLSEEYDVPGKRQVGNTPQALSHLALVRAADAIGRRDHAGTPGRRRKRARACRPRTP
ncbi:MAG: glycoside hydrolase family 15 protein [Galbitalea sp.]